MSLKITKDGYYLPQTDSETAEAIEHNTLLAGQKGVATHEDLMKRARLNKPDKPKTTVLTIQSYIQNVEMFYEKQQFFYDKNELFWWWNSCESKYERVDDTDLMDFLDQELQLNGQTVTGGIKSAYMEAFRRIGRRHMPAEAPKTWIQFKSIIVDIKTGEVKKSTPDFFMCNPIPWTPSDDESTPTIDKLFVEWVGEKYKDTLYEIIAYCCLSDYPIHTLFALIGSGRNGKSRFLELINRFIGKANVTSTELDTLLDRPFEACKLHKKLVCVMGETNFGTLKKTSLIKKLTGGDLIGFEYKNKNPFDDYNYAKILISSNSLPGSDDTSEGFYRRWIIIKFPNNFPEGKDILATIPEQEYKNLASKIISILKKLLENGQFSNQGTIEDRKRSYISASNPLTLFLQECCLIDESKFCKYGELYLNYTQYLAAHKHRIIGKKEFSIALNNEGFLTEKNSKNYNGEYQNGIWVYGISILSIPKVKDSADFSSSPNSKFTTDVLRVNDVNDFSLSCSIRRNEVKHSSHCSHDSLNSEIELNTLDQLSNILLEKVNLEMPWNDIIKHGFTDEQLKKWISEGQICEPRSGIVKLL